MNTKQVNLQISVFKWSDELMPTLVGCLQYNTQLELDNTWLTYQGRSVIKVIKTILDQALEEKRGTIMATAQTTPEEIATQITCTQIAERFSTLASEYKPSENTVTLSTLVQNLTQTYTMAMKLIVKGL